MKIESPLGNDQLKQGDLIKPGTYDFEIINAEDTQSKAGNDMIKAQIKVWTDNGRERIVFDYLLEALPFKLGHFFESIGLHEQYKVGDVSADSCIGKSGQCKIGIQADKTGQYGDKNVVLDYIPTDEAHAAKTQERINNARQKDDDFLNDPLPF